MKNRNAHQSNLYMILGVVALWLTGSVSWLNPDATPVSIGLAITTYTAIIGLGVGAATNGIVHLAIVLFNPWLLVRSVGSRSCLSWLPLRLVELVECCSQTLEHRVVSTIPFSGSWVPDLSGSVDQIPLTFTFFIREWQFLPKQIQYNVYLFLDRFASTCTPCWHSHRKWW